MTMICFFDPTFIDVLSKMLAVAFSFSVIYLDTEGVQGFTNEEQIVDIVVEYRRS